jgi:hypothetical protein
MICGFGRSADPVAGGVREAGVRRGLSMMLRVVAASLVLFTFCSGQMRPAHASAMTRATAAYARGDYLVLDSSFRGAEPRKLAISFSRLPRIVGTTGIHLRREAACFA